MSTISRYFKQSRVPFSRVTIKISALKSETKVVSQQIDSDLNKFDEKRKKQKYWDQGSIPQSL